MNKVRCVISIFVITLGLCLIQPVSAAKFPSRPINLIMPFGVGNAPDAMARIIGEYLQKKHNITLVIVSKPGGGGVPAMMDVIHSQPNGYTLSLTSANVLTVLPQYKNVGFTYSDLAHVAQLTTFTMGWAVHVDSGITSIEELMKKAEENPGKYTLASPGAFSGQRFFHNALMKHFPKADFPYVAYDSGAEVVAALLGKHVSVGFTPIQNFIPHKDLRIIAVSSAQRSPQVPDAQTFVEVLGKDFVYDSIYGIVASKKTPSSVLKQLEELFAEALRDPEVQQRFKKVGVVPSFLPGSGFTRVLGAYSALFEEPIRQAREAAKK